MPLMAFLLLGSAANSSTPRPHTFLSTSTHSKHNRPETNRKTTKNDKKNRGHAADGGLGTQTPNGQKADRRPQTNQPTQRSVPAPSRFGRPLTSPAFPRFIRSYAQRTDWRCFSMAVGDITITISVIPINRNPRPEILTDRGLRYRGLCAAQTAMAQAPVS